MRGKVTDDDISDEFEGITPAYAGKRIHEYKSELKNQDHPRVCGEKLKK